jgi:hypothetical protein
MSWASQHLSSLAALVHALEDDYPPDVATLAELSDLLAKAKTANSLRKDLRTHGSPPMKTLTRP